MIWTLTSTTAMVLGLSLLAYGIYFHNLLFSKRMVRQIEVAAITTVCCIGLGYAASHLGIGASVAASYNPATLLAIEAASSFGLSLFALLGILGGTYHLIYINLEEPTDRSKVKAIAPICIVLTALLTSGAAVLATLAPSAFAAAVGAAGVEARAIEVLGAISISIAAFMAVNYAINKATSHLTPVQSL